jgi:hypothetical protein
MTEQKESCKNFIEDVAKIDLEYIIVHAVDGINMEEEVTDPYTGENTYQVVNIPQTALQQLKATVKIDVTPKGVYDKFAQEQTLENFLTSGLFHAQRLSELKAYVESLDEDSVAPKMKLEKIIERMEEEQRRIAMIEAEAQAMQQRAQQFLMGDPDEQADMMAQAQMQIMNQQPIEGEAEVIEEEQAQVEEAEKKTKK